MFWAGTRWGEPILDGAERLLAQVVDAESEEAAAREDETPSYYTCGMHPWVVLPAPGLCPICQMDLTPIDPAKFTGEVTIDPVVVQNIGVRVQPVVTGPLVRTIRTVGTVDYDETRVRDVNTKVAGWIEELHVDYLGSPVEVGQPLFDLYSPALYEAQEQLLLSLANRDQIGASFVPDAAEGARNLVEASRTRLLYYDVTAEQVEALERAGEPSKAISILSPHDGVVIAKHANEGMRVDPGMQMFRIADLSKVWVMVTLYENQLPYVEVGQRAVMRLPYVPGMDFEGKVIYLYPYLDKRTRQVSVRLEFDNPGLLLKPGMFANIELKGELARERTLAPRESVIDTGKRQVAFVSLGEGRFEPRNVRMGIENDDGMVEIVEGLRPGEMVVTSGQFLIDSEAKIREALGKMVRGELAADQQAIAAVAGESELDGMPPELALALERVLDAYFVIGERLASDASDGIADPARTIAGEVDRMLAVEIQDDPHFWHRHEEVATVRGEALQLIEPVGLEEARLQFADLSVALARLTMATGVPPSYGREVQELHCPMYRDGQGGSSWLQAAGKVKNPYYGSSMLGCFDERRALPVTGGGAPEPEPEASEPEPQEPVSRTTAPGGGEAADPATEVSSPGPDGDEPEATPSEDEAIDRLFAAYLAIGELLAEDELQGVAGHHQEVHEAAAELARLGGADVAAHAREIARSSAAKPGDVASVRETYEELSAAVVALAAVRPPRAGVAPALFEAYCPMAGAAWLQTSETVSNPYYGSAMLRCGSVRRRIELLED